MNNIHEKLRNLLERTVLTKSRECSIINHIYFFRPEGPHRIAKTEDKTVENAQRMHINCRIPIEIPINVGLLKKQLTFWGGQCIINEYRKGKSEGIQGFREAWIPLLP